MNSDRATAEHRSISTRFAAGVALTGIAAWLLPGSHPYRPVETAAPCTIDMHCHVAGIGAGGSGCFVSPSLRRSWRYAIYLRSFGVSEKELLQNGDALITERLSQTLAQSRYVKKAVILAMDGVVDQNGLLDTNLTEVYIPNDFVAAAVARHANFLFGSSVHPNRKDALERLRSAKQQGAVLIKWLPSIMHIDPSDPRNVPYYTVLVELDLPLLVHCGQERSFSTSRDELCDPEKLRLPLSMGVRVIAAHIASTGRYGGERSVDRLGRLMREYPRLYSDISSLTQLNKRAYIKEAITRPEFQGRLFYGSDFPLINTALVSPWYYINRLGFENSMTISRISNPWDADVLTKQHLGVPSEVFAKFEDFLAR